MKCVQRSQSRMMLSNVCRYGLCQWRRALGLLLYTGFAVSLVFAMPAIVSAEVPSAELAATMKSAERQVKGARKKVRRAKRSRSKRAGKLRVSAVSTLGEVLVKLESAGDAEQVRSLRSEVVALLEPLSKDKAVVAAVVSTRATALEAITSGDFEAALAALDALRKLVPQDVALKNMMATLSARVGVQR